LTALAQRHGAAVADVHRRFLGHGTAAGDPAQSDPRPANRDLWYCAVIEPNAWGAAEIRHAWWHSLAETTSPVPTRSPAITPRQSRHKRDTPHGRRSDVRPRPAESGVVSISTQRATRNGRSWRMHRRPNHSLRGERPPPL
jgi:hypothetical protein